MPRRSSTLTAAFVAATLAAASLAALAQDETVAPRITSRATAPEIENRAGVPVEGWAVVRYSVLADGTADNIHVVDIAPPSADPDAVIEAVEDWSFAPATAGGEAIDWHNNEATVLFAGVGAGDTPPPEFLELYESTGALNDAQDFDAAREQSDELVNEVAVRRQDIAIALAQAAIAELGAGDFHAALGPLRLSTNAEAAALPAGDLFIALQLQFQNEIQLGRTLAALETYERLAAGYGPDEANPYTSVAEELQNAWDSEEFLAIFGMLGEADPWYVRAGRGYFYIDNIEGEIDSLTAECDRQRLELDFQSDADYRLPDRFGDCVVFVDGEPGTSFSLVEVIVAEE